MGGQSARTHQLFRISRPIKLTNYCNIKLLAIYLLNFIVEHVHEKVECNAGQAAVLHGQPGEGVHGGHAHGKALVLQAVDEGATASQTNEVDGVGAQLLLRRVVCPFLT